MTVLKNKLSLLVLFLILSFIGVVYRVDAQVCGYSCPVAENPCTNESICDVYEPYRQENVCVSYTPCRNDWVCVAPYSYEADVECPPCQDYTNWECTYWEQGWDDFGNQQWYCAGSWNEVRGRSCNTCRQTINGCSQWNIQCVGGGCDREETRSVGGGCISSHIACLGGGCPVAKDPVFCPQPTSPACVADITCITADGTSYSGKVCSPKQCPADTVFPTKPAPGCNQVGEPYPINEPGKCARNCTSPDGITNLWDYVACDPGVNPEPEGTCVTWCGFLGNSVNDGKGGFKTCPPTTPCPAGGNYVGGVELTNPNGPFGNPTPPPLITTSTYFQTNGGSVMTLGGAVSVNLPTGEVFSKDGEGGSPGIPMGNGESSFGSGTISSTGWIAGDAFNTQGVISDKVSYRYDIDQIKGKIISLVKPEQLIFSNIYNKDDLLKGTPEPDGTYYVQTNDDLVISSDLDLGTSRVVVITEKNAKIDGTIKFDDGGLFAVIARENIEINPNIGGSTTGVDPDGVQPNIEGVFFAQKRFKTGAGNKQLRIDGPVVGIEGVDLERTHTSQYPAEYFVFRPDILMTLPQHLLRRNNLWQEALP